jgi:hypothetical protein
MTAASIFSPVSVKERYVTSECCLMYVYDPEMIASSQMEARVASYHQESLLKVKLIALTFGRSLSDFVV